MIFGDEVAGRMTVKDPALAAETGREEPPGPARRGERLRCARAAPARENVRVREGERKREKGGGAYEKEGEREREICGGACQQSRTVRSVSVHCSPTSRARLARAQ